MIRRCLFLLAAGAALVAWLWSASHTQSAPPGPPIIQLTNSGAIDARPAWSPDNRLIAFQSNRGSATFHIYVMDADGSHQRQLTQGSADDRHPSWRPDGTAILYDSSSGGESGIWTVNLTDGSRKQITHVGGEASFPSASPDGQHITFYVYQNLTLDLWTARLDGSEAKPLTHGLASAANNQCTFACHQAAWSPDSQRIAYSAGELDTIWVIPSNGGNPSLVIGNNDDNHFPWFTADGKLGYITEHVSPYQSWTDAWVYDFQSGKASLLQEHMSAQGPFEWSRDNTQVLFHSPRSGNFEIYMIDLTAPGGVEALRGTPVPAALASGTSNPAAFAGDSSAAVLGEDKRIVGLALGTLALAGAAGIVLWRRSKH
jgi:dipeptidyl aminopeptidase/acylaminoacyl peptidase